VNLFPSQTSQLQKPQLKRNIIIVFSDNLSILDAKQTVYAQIVTQILM